VAEAPGDPGRRVLEPGQQLVHEADRTELDDLASAHPDLVATLDDAWRSWADRCGVIPREKVLDLYAARGHGLPEE
jgi:arylsulfatase